MASSLVADLINCFLSPQEYFSDVSFILDDGVIYKTHRMYLASHSKLFQKLFESKPEQKIFHLHEISSSSFGDILKILYCASGNFSNNEIYWIRVNSKKLKINHLEHFIGHTSFAEIPLKISHQLEKWVNNQEFSDVCFKVEEKKIYAHKFVLSARCEYFYSMFHSSMLESLSQEIVFDGADYDTTLIFFTYLYTSNLCFPEGEEISYCFTLFLLADQLLHNKLKNLCQQKFSQFLTKENAIEFWKLSNEVQMDSIQNLCENFIANKLSFFSETKEYQEFDQTTQERIKRISLANKPSKNVAPWVEMYLNTPHSTPLRVGESISLEKLFEWGFSLEDYSVFEEKREEAKKIYEKLQAKKKI